MFVEGSYMSSKTIVVYDPTVEDSTSLSKFLGVVLEKVGLVIKDVEFVKVADYIYSLDESISNHHTICLNKTYSTVSLKIADILKESTSKFFSRNYNNPTRNLIVIGLIMSIDEIFSNTTNKKTAWSKLVTFHKTSTEYSGTPCTTEVNTPVKDEIANVEVTLPEGVVSKKEVVEVKEVEDVVIDKPIKAKRTTTKKSVTPVTKEDPPSYAKLLEFYNIAKTILEGMDKLKMLDKELIKLL